MSAALPDQRGVTVQIQRPALRPVDTLADCFPARTMPVEVPVLQLDSRTGRRLGVEPHFDLASLSRIGLDGPLRADIPAEHDPVRRIESQDPRPPALAAVG